MLDLVDPVGYPPVHAQAKRRIMETPAGRRVGFIWNQYQTTKRFWPFLEKALETACNPSAVLRAYKGNTWSPLDKTQFDDLAGSVDYLVVGVGA